MVVIKMKSKAARPKQAILMFLFSIILILATINSKPETNIVYAPPGMNEDIMPIKTSVIKKWFNPSIPKGKANKIRPKIASFFMI